MLLLGDKVAVVGGGAREDLQEFLASHVRELVDARGPPAQQANSVSSGAGSAIERSEDNEQGELSIAFRSSIERTQERKAHQVRQVNRAQGVERIKANKQRLTQGSWRCADEPR